MVKALALVALLLFSSSIHTADVPLADIFSPQTDLPAAAYRIYSGQHSCPHEQHLVARIAAVQPGLKPREQSALAAGARENIATLVLFRWGRPAGSPYLGTENFEGSARVVRRHLGRKNLTLRDSF
jgi:hypothetical protein